MPIHLPIPLEPFMGTDDEWQAYFKVRIAATNCYIAYIDTIGLFALFSQRKKRLFKDAKAAYEQAYDEYNVLMGYGKARVSPGD